MQKGSSKAETVMGAETAMGVAGHHLDKVKTSKISCAGVLISGGDRNTDAGGPLYIQPTAEQHPVAEFEQIVWKMLSQRKILFGLCLALVLSQCHRTAGLSLISARNIQKRSNESAQPDPSASAPDDDDFQDAKEDDREFHDSRDDILLPIAAKIGNEIAQIAYDSNTYFFRDNTRPFITDMFYLLTAGFVTFQGHEPTTPPSAKPLENMLFPYRDGLKIRIRGHGYLPPELSGFLSLDLHRQRHKLGPIGHRAFAQMLKKGVLPFPVSDRILMRMRDGVLEIWGNVVESGRTAISWGLFFQLLEELERAFDESWDRLDGAKDGGGDKSGNKS
ncbi:hypothetical protein HK102_000472 [Quaeritorhiza haematococci]|nr:hypothetical protein HK102_000472 [Quaeritorhiza haematococci]